MGMVLGTPNGARWDTVRSIDFDDSDRYYSSEENTNRFINLLFPNNFGIIFTIINNLLLD